MITAETLDHSEDPREPITDPVVVERFLEAIRESNRAVTGRMPSLTRTDLSARSVLPANIDHTGTPQIPDRRLKVA